SGCRHATGSRGDDARNALPHVCRAPVAGKPAMRNLTAFLAAFTVILGIVSGGLWRDLRADRQQIVDLQAQLAEAQASAAAQAAQLAALRATVVTPATPPVSVAQSAPP